MFSFSVMCLLGSPGGIMSFVDQDGRSRELADAPSKKGVSFVGLGFFDLDDRRHYGCVSVQATRDIKVMG